MQMDPQMLSRQQESQVKPLSRRDFVRVLTVASTAGPGLVAASLTGFALTRTQRAEAAEMVVAAIGKLTRYKLGRLPMKVTQVCMSSDWNPELFGPAVALGINFVHKAGYWGENVPEEIKKLPRESYYTDITVDNTSPGNDPDNYDQAYNQVIDSLNKNGLKYYDIYRAHYGWHNLDSFKKNTSYKAFQRLKREGKVKYFGVSQHPYTGEGTQEDLSHYPELIDAEVASGLVDSMQVWYSYGYPKEVEAAFARASKAGVGMTAMKINAHGQRRITAERMRELSAEGMKGRALLRHVLTKKRPDGKPIFATCVSALGNLQVFEENVGAVSKQVALRDGFSRIEELEA